MLERDDGLTVISLEWQIGQLPAELPSNVRSIQNRKISNFDLFYNTGMEDILQVMWDVLEKWSHGHIFCLQLQLVLCYKGVQKVGETGEESVHEEDGEAATRTFRCSRRIMLP